MAKRIKSQGPNLSRIGVADRTVEVGQRWWPIMTTAYTALLTAYAKLSSWFSGFGWIDALVFGFVGALVLTTLTLVLFVAYRQLRPALPPIPDRKSFRDEVVNLSDLIAHAPIIFGKEFTRCVIRGPGQIKLQKGICYLFCTMLERNIVEASPGSNITGAVIVVDCSFVECYFDTAIVGTPNDVRDLRGAVEHASLADWEKRYARF